MKKFLLKVATDLIERHQHLLSEIQVVLPSKRSGLFLNQHLSSILKKPFIAPRIITWNEFLEEHSDFTVLDSISLHFRAYESYLKVSAQPETFEDFTKWSHVALSDFNDIDNYLLDAKLVFKNLRNIKEIEDWSFNLSELSTMQSDFLGFWEMLGSLYTQFSEDLFRSGALYSGALKKHLALDMGRIGKAANFTYWAGFYAISPAEQAIIDYFLNEKKGYVYWDADEYYVDSPINPAGHFFRKAILKSKKRYHWIDDKVNDAKEIIIHEAPGNVIQANIANEVVRSNPQKETAIVLSDEQLLIPILENLEPTKDKFNVSLGLSIDKSDLFQLMDSILLMHEEPYRRKNNGTHQFYHKHVEQVLENKLILHLYPGIQSGLSQFRKSGVIYYSEIMIRSMLDYNHASELEFIFRKVNTIPDDLVHLMDELIELLKQSINAERWDSFSAEILFKTSQFLKQLNNYCREYPYISTFSSFKKLLKQLSSSEKLDFLGEPLGGLQILGMLESRALDFDRVIVTSCNEGVLPSNSIKPSFLPYDLKLQYGLPTKKEYESIYAYYFNRLMHCSSEVHLIYNSKTPIVGSGEKSRFISQLKFENHEGKFKPDISENIYATEIKVSSLPETEIIKDPQMIQSIREYFLPRISSSSITSFFSCPLDFYYKYILHIQDRDFFEEKIQPNTFGSILHGLLESLYQPFVNDGKIVSKEFDYSSKAIRQHLDAVITKEKLTDYLSSPYNALAVNAISHIVSEFLAHEKSIITKNELEILGLEEKVSQSFELKSLGEVGLKGSIDRIDRLNGRLRILDYKSPMVKDNEVEISDLSKEEFIKKPYAFQLMFYSLLYSLNTEEQEMIFPSIISMRRPRKTSIDLKVNKQVGISKDQLDQFKVVLEDILTDILHPDIVFKHNKKATYCSFCNE